MKKKSTCFFIFFFFLFSFSLYSQSVDNEPCITNNWNLAISITTSDDYIANSSIHADLSENIYVAGQFSGTITLGEAIYENTGGSDGYLAKFNSSGVLLWSTHIIAPGFASNLQVTTDAFDNVYLLGDFSDSLIVEENVIISNNNSNDLFLIKFNPNNELQWMKKYGGSNTDAFGDVGADHLGNIILSGKFKGSTEIGGVPLSSLNGNDFIFKINSAGNLSWLQQFGNSYIWGTSLAVKSDNNIIVSGVYNSTFKIQGTTLPTPVTPTRPNADAAFLAEVSSEGNLIWLKNANTGSNSKIVLGLDRYDAVYLGGNFFEGDFIVGDSTHTGPAGFIAKYDSQGNPQWSRKIGDFYFNWISGISSDAANNVFTTGILTSSISFGGESYTGNGGFLAKYNSEGEELKLWSTGSFSYDRTDFLSSDSKGNIYCTGIFNSSVLFGDHMISVKEGYDDIFIAKLEAGTSNLSSEPTTATSKISFSNINPESVDLSWTSGDGLSRIIIAKKMGKVNINGIEDGTIYNAGEGIFTNGTQTGPNQYIVYNGTGNSARVSGLDPGKVYTFTALEYNEEESCGQSINYKITQNKIAYLVTPGSKSASRKLVVSPNPVYDDMTVTLSTKTRGQKNLVLLDNYGRAVKNFELNIAEDITQTDFDLSSLDLAPGLYYLKLENEDGPKGFRMIKR